MRRPRLGSGPADPREAWHSPNRAATVPAMTHSSSAPREPAGARTGGNHVPLVGSSGSGGNHTP